MNVKFTVTAVIDVHASSLAEAVTVVQSRVQQVNVDRDVNSVLVQDIRAVRAKKDAR